jgi:hypothetical protein
LWNEIRGHKVLNDNKFKGIVQEKEEHPMAFYDRLEEVFRKYTNLDPESVEGGTLLHHHLPQILGKRFRNSIWDP